MKSTAKIKIGTNRSECSLCGQVFKSNNMFEKHQKRKPNGDIFCKHPCDVGLVLRDVGDGLIWAYPPVDNLGFWG